MEHTFRVMEENMRVNFKMGKNQDKVGLNIMEQFQKGNGQMENLKSD